MTKDECPKCKGVAIKLVYVPAGLYGNLLFPLSDKTFFNSIQQKNGTFNIIVVKEHMRKTCLRCHYCYAGECSDSEVKA